jgi:hypothetical protein
MTTGLLPVLVNAVTGRQVRAIDMSAQGGAQAITLNSGTGTLAGASIPANAAMVVSQRTAKRGRSYRGRAYLSGLAAGNLVNAVDANVTSASSIVAAFAALDSALLALAAPLEIGVWSRQHNNIVTSPGEFNRAIAYIVDVHYDSQRRRLFGRGN